MAPISKRLIVIGNDEALHLWLVKPGRSAWRLDRKAVCRIPDWMEGSSHQVAHRGRMPLWLVDNPAVSA